MCGGDGTIDERIYQIRDRFILFEFYGYDSEVGKAHVQITELPKDQKESCWDGIYEGKVKKMPLWMKGHKPIVICAEDFETTIDAGIERAFEDMWDDLTEEEYKSIPEKLIKKIEKKVTDYLLKNCRGLD